MRAKELRDRTDEELRTMESNLRSELFTARFKNYAGQTLYDSNELPKKRRDLARVLTILRQREMDGTQGGSEQGEE